MANLFDIVDEVHFVDVGCSGDLDEKWRPLMPRLCYTGFDPNAAECERLRAQPHPYRSCRYLPYAIAGEPGSKTLYKTESIYCYSLLRPNHPWLQRFTFEKLFTETGTEQVPCSTLDEVAQQHQLQADVLKLDTQGLEVPILNAAGRLLEGVFCVETETGFVDNYIGETVYAEIDRFMRARGYLLFDLNHDHRIARKGPLAKLGKHQPLWCEAVWLFDCVGRGVVPTRERALRALLICKTLQYYDYGLELARHFRNAALIDADELAFLEQPDHWLN